MKRIRNYLGKNAVKCCFAAFFLGIVITLFVLVLPQKSEMQQYRAAGFWINYLNQNPGFGKPLGMAWKGSDLVVVYSTSYKLVISPTETYAMEPDGFRATMSFRVFPPADVRGHKLEQLEKLAAH